MSKITDLVKKYIEEFKKGEFKNWSQLKKLVQVQQNNQWNLDDSVEIKTLIYSFYKELQESENNSNDGRVQVSKAFFFHNGIIVEHDYTKASKLYQEALVLGNNTAMNNLATMYGYGLGVPENHLEEVRLLKLAVEGNNAIAMTNLGIMYEKGTYVIQDYEEAIKLYQKAASLNNSDSDAYFCHAMMYIEGRGVEKNNTTAIELLQKSCDLDNPLAMVYLAKIYANGEYVAQNYAKTLEYSQKARDLGSSHATFLLAKLHYYGKGVKQNYDEAVMLIREAIAWGNSDALAFLAGMYLLGRGIEQNTLEAIKLYEQARLKNNAYAICSLGMIYFIGIDAPQDYGKAIELFEQAMALGNRNAITNLGVMYARGLGLEQNYFKAISFLQQAIELGDAFAYQHLIYLYETVSEYQNYPQAARLRRQLVENGIEIELPEFYSIYHSFHMAIAKRQSDKALFFLLEDPSIFSELYTFESIHAQHSFIQLMDALLDEEFFRGTKAGWLRELARWQKIINLEEREHWDYFMAMKFKLLKELAPEDITQESLADALFLLNEALFDLQEFNGEKTLYYDKIIPYVAHSTSLVIQSLIGQSDETVAKHKFSWSRLALPLVKGRFGYHYTTQHEILTLGELSMLNGIFQSSSPMEPTELIEMIHRLLGRRFIIKENNECKTKKIKMSDEFVLFKEFVKEIIRHQASYLNNEDLSSWARTSHSNYRLFKPVLDERKASKIKTEEDLINNTHRI
jgi:TPR repeat protein